MCKSSCSSQVTVPGSVWHKCLLCTPGAGCDNSTLCSHRKALTPPQGGAAESLPSPDESLWLPSSSRLLSSLHSPGVLLSRGACRSSPTTHRCFRGSPGSWCCSARRFFSAAAFSFLLTCYLPVMSHPIHSLAKSG